MAMTLPEDEDDEQDDSDDSADGVERCPICDRANDPGADDACAHFFGRLWDGDVLWSDDFATFADAWSELTSAVEEAGATHDKPLSACRDCARQAGLPVALLRRSLLDASAANVLVELVDFWEGESVATSGMLGGSGYSLYLASREPVSALVQQVLALAAAIRRRA
jgi:hypothetical protein